MYHPYLSTIPEPHDYLWYFLKWLGTLMTNHILDYLGHLLNKFLPGPKTEPTFISDELQAFSDNLVLAARAGKIDLDEELLGFYAVGSSTPQWYRKTGKTFRGADILEAVPEYDETMLVPYPQNETSFPNSS